MGSRILFLDQDLDHVSRRLRGVLSEAGLDHRVEYFDSDKALLERLLGPLDDIMLTIIRVRDKEHLVQLAIHSMFLRGIRVVVVLPEMGHESITIAHIFHPSLVLSVEDDFGEVAAIVDKLMRSETEEGNCSPGGPSPRRAAAYTKAADE
ncbi:MAG: hypothetical protein K1Y02_08140 [Candidatus Hydrogenedentes bacterium]|nr:hypothetical protein [Candidatus Hydrogenedentota bacterium]